MDNNNLGRKKIAGQPPQGQPGLTDAQRKKEKELAGIKDDGSHGSEDLTKKLDTTKKK
jgi:hypothetical protein